MNKNAYEIRLEVLHIAHSDAMQSYHEALNANRDERGHLANPELAATLFPKTEDIKKRAAELYEFVCDVK